MPAGRKQTKHCNSSLPYAQWCEDCKAKQREYRREYAREYRNTPKQREYRREYAREYRNTPKQREYAREYWNTVSKPKSKIARIEKLFASLPSDKQNELLLKLRGIR